MERRERFFEGDFDGVGVSLRFGSIGDSRWLSFQFKTSSWIRGRFFQYYFLKKIGGFFFGYFMSGEFKQSEIGRVFLVYFIISYVDQLVEVFTVVLFIRCCCYSNVQLRGLQIFQGRNLRDFQSFCKLELDVQIFFRFWREAC